MTAGDFDRSIIAAATETGVKPGQAGFTLVELVVVIVVLGILAATALPRFINVSRDARIAAVQGAAGGLRAAVAVTQARYFAAGALTATSVTMADGTVVAVNAGNGRPTGTLAGIGTAMNCESATACAGMTVTFGGTAIWRPQGAASTSCNANYELATGIVAVFTTNC